MESPIEANFLLKRWQQLRALAPPVAVWLPSLLVAIAMLLPLLYLVIRSTDSSQESWSLIFRLRTALIIARSLVLVFTVTLLSLILAVPLAWLTQKTDLPYRRVWTVLVALPLVIPSYVGAFLIISALGPKGLLQQMLSGPFGVEQLPNIYGLPGATLTLALLSYPYIFLTMRGALNNLDPSLEESARSLGHTPQRVLFWVTLTQLRPAIGAGALLVALYTLSDFGAVSLLRYETFTWAIYQQYQSVLDRATAASLSLILIGVATILIVMEAFSRGQPRYHSLSHGSPRKPRSIRLGHWKWPALGICISVVMAALALPMAVLVYWLVRGLNAGEPILGLWGTVRNTVYVSGLASLTAVICSIPVAVMSVRYHNILSQVIGGATYIGYALPGIVVALSLVFFGANFAHGFYQTVWLLLFAYIVLFLPAALGSVRSTMLQINPNLEEAARSLGRKTIQVMVYVTAPLMLPGLLTGAVMVFLLTMKELPATLILSPPGFKTLATTVWSASSEAFFAQAAAPAMILILMSSIPMIVLIINERIREENRIWT